jgi:hypothetical protein
MEASRHRGFKSSKIKVPRRVGAWGSGEVTQGKITFICVYIGKLFKFFSLRTMDQENSNLYESFLTQCRIKIVTVG